MCRMITLMPDRLQLPCYCNCHWAVLNTFDLHICKGFGSCACAGMHPLALYLKSCIPGFVGLKSIMLSRGYRYITLRAGKLNLNGMMCVCKCCLSSGLPCILYSCKTQKLWPHFLKTNFLLRNKKKSFTLCKTCSNTYFFFLCFFSFLLLFNLAYRLAIQIKNKSFQILLKMFFFLHQE